MLWGGRFEGQVDELMRRFHDSFGFDRRLYAADITGSIAYAQALQHAGLLTGSERDAIIEGLKQVQLEFDEGHFEARSGDDTLNVRCTDMQLRAPVRAAKIVRDWREKTVSGKNILTITVPAGEEEWGPLCDVLVDLAGSLDSNQWHVVWVQEGSDRSLPVPRWPAC